MRICLVRPIFGSRFQVTPPLSLGYLSSALKKGGYSDVSLIDGSLDMLTPELAVARLAAQGGADVVGIQVYTGSHAWTREFTALVKKGFPKAVVVVGGPHVTALKAHAMDFIGADYGVIGEGEIPAVAFMGHLEGKIPDPAKVPGLFYKEDGRWRHAEEQYGFVPDANSIPFPDWELLQPQKYFEFMEGATMPLRGKRPAPVLTSRGCPYLCTFCSSGLTNKRIMRYRAPRNIVDEIKFLKEKYGVNEIFFSDDNLTMDIKRAEEIFDLLINEKVGVHWRAPNGIRLDRLTPSLVEKMARSGGYYVGVGVETGNPEIMKRIKKRVDLNIVRNVVNLLHKHKIMVSGFFMCGLRGETAAQVEDSVRFALSVPFDRIQVSNYIPYPGSEDFSAIFEESVPEKYAENAAKFQESEYVPHFQEMSLEEIIALQKAFIRRFYLRPRVILGFLLNLELSQLQAIWRHPFIQRWFSRQQKWF